MLCSDIFYMDASLPRGFFSSCPGMLFATNRLFKLRTLINNGLLFKNCRLISKGRMYICVYVFRMVYVL